jgi:hypothetical protein
MLDGSLSIAALVDPTHEGFARAAALPRREETECMG